MKISITGKHMETGSALKAHVDDHLGAAVSKYFENAIGADVTFTKKEPFFLCHISVNEGVKDGLIVSADAKAENVYTAFNEAMHKAEKQLRRYKRKLKDRSHKVSVKELSIEMLRKSA